VASGGGVLSDVRAFTLLGDPSSGGVQAMDDLPVGAAAIPALRVEVGLASAGTPEHDVSFSPAALAGPSFSATLDASTLPPGSRDAWARVCLGETCASASVPA